MTHRFQPELDEQPPSKAHPGKTEVISIPALTSPLLDFSISLGDTPLTLTHCARNLIVVMDVEEFPVLCDVYLINNHH